MNQTAPLLSLFLELRRRNFPLGVDDYLLALDALARGLGGTSRAQLVRLCQTLWAKSLEEQAEVAELMAILLPPQLTEAELATLMQQADQPAPPDPHAHDRPIPPPDMTVRQADDSPAPATTTGPPRPALEPMGMQPGASANLPLPTWHLNPNLDLVGTLPITRRQMKHAWRVYRRMRRIGPPTELDVQATVEQMNRDGVLTAPVLVPRRRNLARMLILKDEGGSMVPFQRVTQPLLESALHSGLDRVAICYFHDVPGSYVYRDPWLSQPVPLEETLAPFAEAGILIVSDAGAARGNYDSHRLKQTYQFLQRLRPCTANVAWLNPTPRARWRGTSAEAIHAACGGAMFSLERTGLHAAVNVLRGR